MVEGHDVTVLDPSNGHIVAELRTASPTDIEKVLTSAVEAQRAWSQVPGSRRGRLLEDAASALREMRDALATEMGEETGRAEADCAAEVGYAAELADYHAGWGRRLLGEVIPSDYPQERILLERRPYGVVVGLISFNAPIYTLVRKLAPAIMAGNTLIVSPSHTPPLPVLSAIREVFGKVLPAGLVQGLILDNSSTARMCADERVSMITLTGGVAAARAVIESSKANMARVSLELGGKTPAIVTASADLTKAASEIARSALANCGQLCTSVERVYVDRSVHDAFVDAIAPEFSRYTAISDHTVASEKLGPLISAKAREHVAHMVETAVQSGARVVCGGKVPAGPGFYYPATLLDGCTQEMDVVRSEVFGPVLAIVAVDDGCQAAACANLITAGLTAVIYCRDYAQTMRLIDSMECGEVYVNRHPADAYQGYHAGWKRSGVGGDDGYHGLLEYTQTRVVTMNYQ